MSPAPSALSPEPSLLALAKGRTFDDFLLTPQLGVAAERAIPPPSISATRFSTNLTLKRPLVSANMDTITRAAMAVVLAEEGGIGVIDRGFRRGDIAPQVAEVDGRQADAARRHHRSAHDRRERTARRRRCGRWSEPGVGTLVVVDEPTRGSRGC